MSAKVAGIGWVGLLAAVLADVPKLPGRLCRGRWELFDAEGKRASPTPACAGNAQSLGRVENGPTDGADSRAWWPVCTRGGEELMAQHRRRRRKQGAMTTPDPLAGIGPQRPDDRRGWLLFESLPDAIQRAEDATLYNDYEHQPWRHLRERSATPTERLLLEHLGYTLPAELTTRVEHLSPTIRRRTWPQLETRHRRSHHDRHRHHHATN